MNYTALSDQELIKNYRSGDSDSLEHLILRHQEKVTSYVLNVVKNRHLADDIVQDTFLKVINTIRSGAYKEEGKFIQWVMRIAHNLMIDYFRRQKKFPIAEPGEGMDIFSTLPLQDRSVEDAIIYEQILTDVKRMLKYLPEEQRRVVEMRLYEDLSFKEIAEITKVSINTALGRMRYALINLRKIAKENDIQLSM
ncbi:MAG TPA: sigma-70 family RNA polymerase sigma factor [Bacteroidales bacterium]|jgi:RNA polymerase sigma-70 factor (ECF subfamily)|nr:sigma-70 family RNA polymerase sigma factor [Bacteroidales bacterium]MDI9573511.1 sigma-70 family RNA polymerase sigma factor [Bacteroidota bacterium]OQC59226.1 MAG: ECF RNA polymerase sigma factor SigW [Bacteroidetes bacterium ADurb.Bin012]MBP9512422.1 sigma-70 family RNA polymerase sigma factor [Bacteroidales bacterium]MBP9588877.1 sigma-70 family RNA polymerase sigma factor [Bacteroidales bacterium]